MRPGGSRGLRSAARPSGRGPEGRAGSVAEKARRRPGASCARDEAATLAIRSAAGISRNRPRRVFKRNPFPAASFAPAVRANQTRKASPRFTPNLIPSELVFPAVLTRGADFAQSFFRTDAKAEERTKPADPDGLPASSPTRSRRSEIREQPAVQDALKEAARPAEVEKKKTPPSASLGPGPGRHPPRGGLPPARAGDSPAGVFAERAGSRRFSAALIIVGLLALHTIAKALILPRLKSRATAYNVRRVLEPAGLPASSSSRRSRSSSWAGTEPPSRWGCSRSSWASRCRRRSRASSPGSTSSRGRPTASAIGSGSATRRATSSMSATSIRRSGKSVASCSRPTIRAAASSDSRTPTVFNTSVFNYSWPLFPYIWNEITVQVAYQSDLEFVASVMTETVEEELGPGMEERIRVYRGLLAETPVDHFDVAERPTVIFRVNPDHLDRCDGAIPGRPAQRRTAQDGADEADHRTAQRGAGPRHVPCGERALSSGSLPQNRHPLPRLVEAEAADRVLLDVLHRLLDRVGHEQKIEVRVGDRARPRPSWREAP